MVDAELIHAQGATTLRDVLRNVTGISIQAGEGGGGLPGDNLAIRGFTARNDIFVDGVRDFGAYSRDPYNIEQVEVTKGPASVFGGRGSTGGAINLATKVARSRERASPPTVAAGTDDFQRATARPQPAAARRHDARLGAPPQPHVHRTATRPGRDAVDDERYGIAPSLALGLMGKTRLWLSGSLLDEDNLPDYGIPWVPPTNVPLAAYADQPAPVDYDNFYGLDDRDYEKTETRIGDRDRRSRPRAERHHAGAGARRHAASATRSSPRRASRATTRPTSTASSRRATSRTTSSPARSTSTSGCPTGEHRAHARDRRRGVARRPPRTARARGPPAPLADLFDPDPHAPYAGPITYTGARTENTADTAAAYVFDTVQPRRAASS